MAYKYQEIWDTIKANKCAEIVLHRSLVATTVQGVKRTKSAENVSRPLMGQVPYSKLVIKQEVLSERTGQVKVRFELLYDTRL